MDGSDGRGGSFGQTIRQVREATFSNLTLVAPAVILVEAGEKRIVAGGRSLSVGVGQAVLLPEGEPLAVTNLPPTEPGRTPLPYSARVIPFARELAERAYARLAAPVRPAAGGVLADCPGPEFRQAFDRLFDTGAALPDEIRALRVEEMLLWLARDGALLPPSLPPSFSHRLRRLLAAEPGQDWTAARAATALAVSEATLRRRLAEERTGFSDLLVDVRMSHALALLQTGTLPVGAVAAAVGYDSPSRFAARFRARFALLPSEIRAPTA